MPRRERTRGGAAVTGGWGQAARLGGASVGPWLQPGTAARGGESSGGKVERGEAPLLLSHGRMRKKAGVGPACQPGAVG